MNIILFLSGESNILQTSRGVCIVFHHEKIKFISPSHWVIFFYLIMYTKVFPIKFFHSLSPSTNFIMNCCSLVAGISRSYLLLFSFVTNSLNNIILSHTKFSSLY